MGDSYGYAAVGGLVLVEGFGVPAPGETLLIAAAVYAGAGEPPASSPGAASGTIRPGDDSTRRDVLAAAGRRWPLC